MRKEGIFKRMTEGLGDACQVWWREMRDTVRDEGVLIFFVIVPLVYPLLYSWIYNNEVVREVPVAVVDSSRGALSRDFVRRCDASPDVHVVCYAADMEEAKALLARQEVNGIYYIPADFSTRLNSGRQTVVSVYCDMSLMLTYKAVYQTALMVSQEMNAGVQIALSGNYTDREDKVTTRPLDYEEVPLFNPTGGYGNFILPGVLMLILQQTLVLGIGLAAGTARETNRFSELIPVSRHYRGMFRIVLGKAMCYIMIYSVIAVWLAMIVPRIFGFVSLAGPAELLGILVPYVLACVFFGMTVSCLIRYRENVMLLVVFLSVPLLFLSGASWPQSSIGWFWQSLSWLFPSTFGIRAFVRTNSMGATLADVSAEYRMLWVHVVVYFSLACAVYKYQMYLSRCRLTDRLNAIRRKREVRRKIKKIPKH